VPNGPWQEYQTKPTATQSEPLSDSALMDDQRKSSSWGNQFLDGVTAGAINSIGGLVQTATDLLDPKLSDRVGDMTRMARVALAQDDKGDGAAGVIGGALPYLAVGELTGPEGLLGRLAVNAGGAAVAGATQLQKKGLTAKERIDNRIAGAATGAVGGALLGEAGHGLGTFIGKVTNSKAVQKYLDGLVGMMGTYSPGDVEAAAGLTSHMATAKASYVNALTNLSKAVAATGGVPTDGLHAANVGIKAMLPQLAPTDPARGLLTRVSRVFDNFAPREGADVQGVLKRLGPAALSNPGLRASLKKAGVALDTTHPAGDFSALMDLRNTISEHLDQGGTSAAVPLLQDAKTALDTALEKAQNLSTGKKLVSLVAGGTGNRIDPKVSAAFQQAKARVQPLLDGMKNPLIAPLLKGSPEEQTAALHSLIESGDVTSAKQAANLLGQTGLDKMRAFALREALLHSFEKHTGSIDGTRFMGYFSDPQRAATLKTLGVSQDDPLIAGASKFLRSDGHALPMLHNIMGAGNFATTLGLFGGIKDSIEELSHGKLNAEPIVTALTSGLILKALVRGTQALVTHGVGHHFLVATSKLPEGSPAFARNMQIWAPRLARLLSVSSAQMVGASQPQLPVPYPQPRQ
jgi:hypothetical protein